MLKSREIFLIGVSFGGMVCVGFGLLHNDKVVLLTGGAIVCSSLACMVLLGKMDT